MAYGLGCEIWILGLRTTAAQGSALQVKSLEGFGESQWQKK